jgi:hypothetical protein
LDDCLQCFCVGCEERIGFSDLLGNRIAVSFGNGQVVCGISGGLIRVLESLASRADCLSELKAAISYDGTKNCSIARDSDYSRQYDAPSNNETKSIPTAPKLIKRLKTPVQPASPAAGLLSLSDVANRKQATSAKVHSCYAPFVESAAG